MTLKENFELGSSMVETAKINTKELNNANLSECDFEGIKYVGNSTLIAKEKYIANQLFVRLNMNKNTGFAEDGINSCINEFEEQERITLSSEQRQGVITLLTNNLAILTGGPGTGKTSVTKCILYCINRLDDKLTVPILCLSPTGKAARRMTEATGYPAQTILGCMKYNPKTDRHKCLFNKYIFIDESSMIDIDTMYLLMKSLNANLGARVYFIGDMEQLPSVGAGSILRDMINSQYIPTVQLVKTFRQKEGSVLLENIEIIKKGCNYPLIEGDDFKRIVSTDDFLPLYYKTIAEVGYKNVVVLTPNRKVGRNCAENLNRKIQAKINNRKGYTAHVTRDGRKMTISFRYGDPVIQLENREVANGDIGVIVYADDKKVVAEYSDNRRITYTADTINQLDLAYAISIHKSQGSEYPIAFVLCDKSRMLDRNMIYTAVTRAKKKCFLFGEEKFISEACKRQSTWSRTTALPFLMEEEFIESKIKKGFA